MKYPRLFSLLAALFLAAGAHAADIQRMDPPFWYTGMKNHELQVMFYGKDIASAEFSLKSYPGVKVREVAKVKNPNYLFVYLDVTEKARPGTMTFRFKEGGKVTEKPFELRPHNTKTGAQGFSTQDVLYLIMPDRFANGNPANDDWEQFKADRKNGGGHHGGDLQGIRDHLGYIDSLGVTAVWLNPVQYNRSNASHGYAISDFYLIDPRLGTNEEYCGLVDAAHGMGITVIMDIVHSHSVDNENEGLGFFDGRDDLYFYKGPQGHHPAWGSRCFDYGKDEVIRFLLSNCKFWLEEYHLDGFRFDGVTSMLYWDHGLGKDFGDYALYFDQGVDENAVTYLALANMLVKEMKPGAITIA